MEKQRRSREEHASGASRSRRSRESTPEDGNDPDFVPTEGAGSTQAQEQPCTSTGRSHGGHFRVGRRDASSTTDTDVDDPEPIPRHRRKFSKKGPPKGKGKKSKALTPADTQPAVPREEALIPGGVAEWPCVYRGVQRGTVRYKEVHRKGDDKS